MKNLKDEGYEKSMTISSNSSDNENSLFEDSS